MGQCFRPALERPRRICLLRPRPLSTLDWNQGKREGPASGAAEDGDGLLAAFRRAGESLGGRFAGWRAWQGMSSLAARCTNLDCGKIRCFQVQMQKVGSSGDFLSSWSDVSGVLQAVEASHSQWLGHPSGSTFEVGTDWRLTCRQLIAPSVAPRCRAYSRTGEGL